MVQDCISRCKKAAHEDGLEGEEEGLITPEFFTEMVVSFERAICSLKQEIHHR